MSEMVSPDVVHHGIGHRGSFLQVRVLQPKPYPKTTVTTSHPQATPRPGTPSSQAIRAVGNSVLLERAEQHLMRHLPVDWA